MEVDIQYMASPKLQLYGATTYTYGRNISASEPMRRIPPLFSTIGGYYNLTDRLQIKLNWKHANAQTRLSRGDKDDNRIPVGGSKAWNFVDFSAHYTQNWYTIRLGVNNIFDQAYRTHGSGIDGPGRSLWIALKFNF